MLRLHKHKQDLQEQLRAETRSDPLTGLPLLLGTKNESLEGGDANPPLAVLVIGLDGYAQLLAEQGEEQGTLLVTQSARTVAQCQPANTRLYRYLSSQFILLLPEADQERALAVADEIRSALAADVFDYQSTPVKITASVGISPVAADEADPLAAIKRAATALTTAISRGGNQDCWLPPRESWLEQRKS